MRTAFRPLLGLLALLAGLAALALPAPAQPGRSAYVLQVEGAIGPATVDYVSGGLARAEEEGATLVILRIDTPGGLDSAMRAIIRDILRSPVPVVAYVHPSGARAASAGTFILYASHVAAMTPATNLGAATPVQIGGNTPLPEQKDEKGGEEGAGNRQAPAGGSAMDAKAVNDAVAYIRGLAELRGRNADWAESAVRGAASLSASAALEQGVIEIVARDMGELLAALDGRTVNAGGVERRLATGDLALVTIEPDWRTRLLGAITDPNVALILMMIGVYGLFFEFMNPGALYPGTIGAICLLTGLYALAALPVNFAGAALILLGLALMTAEAFAPSFGILGIGGIVAFMLGGAILIDTDMPEFQLNWPALAGIGVASALALAETARVAVRARRRRIVSGAEEMVGASGTVLDWKSGHGHVFVHSERWRATGPDRLRKDQAVRVTGLDSLVLAVEPAGGERTDEGEEQ